MEATPDFAVEVLAAIANGKFVTAALLLPLDASEAFLITGDGGNATVVVGRIGSTVTLVTEQPCPEHGQEARWSFTATPSPEAADAAMASAIEGTLGLATQINDLVEGTGITPVQVMPL